MSLMSWLNKRNIQFLFVRSAFLRSAIGSDIVVGITISSATTKTLNFLPLYFIIILHLNYNINIIIIFLNVCKYVFLVASCTSASYYIPIHINIYTIVNYVNHKQKGRGYCFSWAVVGYAAIDAFSCLFVWGV